MGLFSEGVASVLLVAIFLLAGSEAGLSKTSKKVGPVALPSEYDYEPTWESLDARPLPSWYDEGKIGIFIHWGVFSVPGFGSEWFWHGWKTSKNPSIIDFMNKNYRPGFTYQDFGEEFTAEFYNASQWTALFKKAGASYVVLTSKHHEGYTLWPSKYSFSWNAMEVGAHRNLLGELADAIRAESDIHFGLYHSLYEWFNPLWMKDRDSNLTTDEFVRFKTLPELYELVNEYQPDIVWSDGEWEAPDSYWKSKEFLVWLYNESPVRDVVVTNDRWGQGTLCNHGGYYTCMDRYNPGVLQPHKWENCFTLDKVSWGYRRNAQIEDYMTPDEVIQTIVMTVSCGGNALINVGPTKEGIIVPIQEERLLQLGEWLDINGEAIYRSVPWMYQNDTLTPGVWFTAHPTEDIVYAIALDWPEDSVLHLEVIDTVEVSSVTLLGCIGEGTLSWTEGNPGIKVTFPSILHNRSKWAWTLKIETTQKRSSALVSTASSIVSTNVICPTATTHQVTQMPLGNATTLRIGCHETSEIVVLEKSH